LVLVELFESIQRVLGGVLLGDASGIKMIVGAYIAEIEARWLDSTLVGMSGGVC
jgi:hypothetical protein